MAGDQDETIDEPWFNTQRRIIAALVALVVIAILLAVLNAAIKTHKTSHQSFSGVTKLDIKVGNGSLTLVDTAGDAIDVQRKVDYLLRGPSLTQKVQGDTLVIKQNCSGLHIGQCDTAYTIAIPRAVATNIVSGGGSVKADNVQGTVAVKTSGGKIQASKTFGNLTLSTDSGRIETSDLSSLEVNATAKGGDVDLEFAVAPTSVNANSNDGDVTVSVPKGNTSYNVVAGSTNSKSTVDVRNDSTSPRSLTARSTNGKVSVETS